MMRRIGVTGGTADDKNAGIAGRKPIRPDLEPRKTALTFGNLVLVYMLRLSQGQDLVLQGQGFTPEELMNYMFDLFTNSLKTIEK